MKKNIILVQPGIGDMDMFRNNPTPPLGLLCAASLICGEMDVRIIDQRTDRNWRAALAAAIDENTIAVGLTVMTGGMISHALEAARVVRGLCGKPLIWGGVHASLLPEQTAAHPLADYVVEGEGELPLAELARRLAAGADTSGIPGVWCKKDGRVISAPRSPLLDLDSIPPVPYHLVDMTRYTQTFRGEKIFFYQSSRGCPCKCAYCYNQTFNLGRLRAKSAAHVLSEIKDLRSRYDFSLIYLLDDNFFIDQGRAMTILSGFKDLGLGCVLQGVDIQTLARMSDADLDLIEAAGVARISIGIESGVDRVRTEILNKEGDLHLARQQIARFKNRKIAAFCSLIVGLPDESPEEIRTTIAFGLEILRLGDNFRVPQFYIFSPYPGTEIFAALERGGTVFPARLEEWGGYDWDSPQLHEKSPALKDFLERACFVSKFLDRKMDDYGSISWVLKALYNAYRPVASFRLRSGFLTPLPERCGYRFLKKLFRRKYDARR